MSERPIQAGDRVVVYRACCKHTEKWLGMVGEAKLWHRQSVDPGCEWCSKRLPLPLFNINDKCLSIWRLKRLPPPEELGLDKEMSDEQRKLPAPKKEKV